MPNKMKTHDLESLHNKHYQQGDTLYKKGKYRDAIKEFEAALKIIPNELDSIWAIGDCYLELGQPDMAEKFYGMALEYCPENKQEKQLHLQKKPKQPST